MFGFWRSRWKASAAVIGVVLALGVHPHSAAFAHDGTIFAAMQKAYRTNPTLQADRARQRGTDELVPAAKSGWRPTITANASATIGEEENDVEFSSHQWSIQLRQPLFRGLRTVHGVRQAKATVEAGRWQLLGIEQDVLLNVANVYMAVIRDRKILRLRELNVTNLQKQVRAAQARFDAGEVTRTDVTQAKARVSGAESSLASAKAQLAGSIARFEQLVGSKPGKLATPPVSKLPKSLDEALAIARTANPDILAAQSSRHAQEHAIEVAKGNLWPEANLSVFGQYSSSNRGGNVTNSELAQIQASVDVPIYDAGRTFSDIREAKHVESQRQLQIIEQGRAVRQAVKVAWNDMIAAREAIDAARSQIYASELSLDGVTQEYLVGSRSTIDILNAEQELTNAKINLASAEYSYLLSSYEVTAAVGRLTARRLALGGPYYDVEENYNHVKDKWIGIDVDTIR